jgi:hypothetical protein
MGHKTSTPFKLIFSDVWGPAPLFSSNGYCYFVIFVDAYIQYIWYYPLVAKSNVYSVFHQFQTLVERQFSLKIKFVQTDWGTKYRKLSTFFQTIGIHHRLIFPHTHEQNRIVESRHRHIVKIGLTLLGQCKASFQFWNYAFETSVYLINRMHTLVLANRSPFDFLFQYSPNYHFLHTFGCLCFPFLRPYNNHKLDFCSSSYVFFGYSSSNLGYRCLGITSQCIYISRHVRFHEHVFPFDNFEQIAKVSATLSIQPSTTLLPNLLYSPLSHTPTAPHHPSSTSALPPLSAHPLQPLPFPSLPHHHMHVYLTILIQVQLVDQSPLVYSMTLLLVLGQSPAFPYFASAKVAINSASAVSPTSVASPLLVVDSFSASSTSLNLVVDFSSYPLQQGTSLPPSSPASPPLVNRHPMVLRSRRPKIANLVTFAIAVIASSREMLSLTSEPPAFSDADRYVV